MSSSSLYIITGSSKGIGKALVDLILLEEDCEVIGISRSKVVKENPNFTHLEIDLGQIDELINGVDEIFPKKEFKKIVLVNNAGWIGEIHHFGNLNDQSFKNIFEINTIAPAIMMNVFVRNYAELVNSERIVVNISSGAAKKSIDGWSGYSASKAALDMLTKTAQLEAELDKSGIRFFSVAPGVVDTDMQSAIRSASEESFSSLKKFKTLKENNQLSSPQHAAEKLLFLIKNPDKFPEVLQDVREF
ncbi:SDR family NAD(P)-dependent oxidoreductase [Aquiflexum sp.]|uniref:SDR family NAD(P)-dependent oxidoreductase n=1 Tax=Aquiflexum sp. TaxID=1872584 RepID=UPI0035941C79